jgi:hypothetical protein
MHYVYWLYNDDCIWPAMDGYIGVTRHMNGRIRTHKKKFQNFDHGAGGPDARKSGHSQETKNKIVAKHVGRKNSSETIMKMQASAKTRADGMVTYGFKGKRHSEETRAKIRAKRALQPEPHLGHKQSKKMKANQSAFAKQQIKSRKRDDMGRLI